MSDKTSGLMETPYIMERLLIITADDFGASENINEGIKYAADKKSITAISALTNFTESLPGLKTIAVGHPEIGVGVHLNITTGKPLLSADQVPSLVNASGNFYTLEQILPVLDKIAIGDLERELRAQINVLTENGISADHLSDHNGIITLYGPFFDVMLELAAEFKVPVRSPLIAGRKYPELFPDSKMIRHGRSIAARFAISSPLKALKIKKYTRVKEITKKVLTLDKSSIPHPDLMIEYFWGNPTLSNLNYILEHLPEGISELIVHLGTGTRQEVYPDGLEHEYFNSREKELQVISGISLSNIYKDLNIRLIGYKDIGEIQISEARKVTY
jgi:predicted glycoside hydrolase/deacetylase ChbG (UPF0249 family)